MGCPQVKREDEQRCPEGEQMQEYHNFSFLVDENTINFIKKSKVMFIMRGLPGSGKSTIVKLIEGIYKTSQVCSADFYFIDKDGKYIFNPDKLSEAHAACQSDAVEACQAARNVIIIDNTNIKRWEMQPYINIARSHNYMVVLVTPQTSWCHDVVELAKRNSHGVPEDVLQRRLSAFQEVYPLYWGWFVNEDDSHLLLDSGRRYFELCIKQLPDFKCQMMKIFGLEGESDLKFQLLYSRNRASTSTLHCTAYYNGGSGMRNTDGGSHYASRDIVKQSVGQSQGLHVIGYTITPRTVGARIALNQRQANLWGNEDNNTGLSRDDTKIKMDSTSESKISDIQSLGGNSSDNTEINLATRDLPELISTKSRQYDQYAISEPTTIFEETVSRLAKCDLKSPPAAIQGQYENLKSRLWFSPTSGFGSRAHFTLGWTKGSVAVQTGYDQLEIISLEGRRRDLEPVLSDGAALYDYGEGRCGIYLDTPIRVNTLFSGKY